MNAHANSKADEATKFNDVQTIEDDPHANRRENNRGRRFQRRQMRRTNARRFDQLMDGYRVTDDLIRY